MVLILQRLSLTLPKVPAGEFSSVGEAQIGTDRCTKTNQHPNWTCALSYAGTFPEIDLYKGLNAAFMHNDLTMWIVDISPRRRCKKFFICQRHRNDGSDE